jgi:hypothetical protein
MKTTLKRVPQPSTATAMKAERERDKAQAVRDYEVEQLARHANMARLRALRLAKERADAQATTARRPVRKRAATQASTSTQVSGWSRTSS